MLPLESMLFAAYNALYERYGAEGLANVKTRLEASRLMHRHEAPSGRARCGAGHGRVIDTVNTPALRVNVPAAVVPPTPGPDTKLTKACEAGCLRAALSAKAKTGDSDGVRVQRGEASARTAR